MLDITASLAANSDQLNAADIIGAPIIVKITKVTEYKDEKQPSTPASGSTKPSGSN